MNEYIFKDGDHCIAEGSGRESFTIRNPVVDGNNLRWAESKKELESGTRKHRWALKNMSLVKAKENIINNYEIY